MCTSSSLPTFGRWARIAISDPTLSHDVHEFHLLKGSSSLAFNFGDGARIAFAALILGHCLHKLRLLRFSVSALGTHCICGFDLEQWRARVAPFEG